MPWGRSECVWLVPDLIIHHYAEGYLRKSYSNDICFIKCSVVPCMYNILSLSVAAQNVFYLLYLIIILMVKNKCSHGIMVWLQFSLYVSKYWIYQTSTSCFYHLLADNKSKLRSSSMLKGYHVNLQLVPLSSTVVIRHSSISVPLISKF